MTTKQELEKLSEKMFLRLIATSIFGVVLCMVCLCSTTWAWFSDSSPSNANEIKTAEKCLISVQVVPEGSDTAIDVSDEAGVLLAAGNYTVTLSLPKDSSSGYYVIGAGANTYLTDYIVHHDEEIPKTEIFTLTLGTESTVVFTPRWGIYADESDVTEAGVLLIP